MAPSSCSLVCNQPPFTSAKTPTATILTLRNAGLNLHPPHPPLHPSFALSFSILSSEPLSVKASLIPLRSSHPQRYVYPDPVPEFAEAETRKFKSELFKKLYKDRDKFGDELDAVIDVCVEVFNNFLHNEYGGPGTLLVEPFTDMFVALKEKQLPGAPLAARASLLWAQNHVDHDWEVWHSNSPR
ncbi:Serine/threonine-protein kinase TAO3 [Hibiscus syriacus]|uniref:Serine/threonine-protein kinase TAO3 n=1 Tax=Hibiscus syriacus TaxID=106335 RepID=A0A6A2ZK66_HIBSY|nr:Serine/threonine-protein kinase TAO3 [Hibiscus syriacus]